MNRYTTPPTCSRRGVRTIDNCPYHRLRPRRWLAPGLEAKGSRGGRRRTRPDNAHRARAGQPRGRWRQHPGVWCQVGGGRDGQGPGDLGVAKRSSQRRPGQTGQGDPTPPERWRKTLASHDDEAWSCGSGEKPGMRRHDIQHGGNGRSRRRSDPGPSTRTERAVQRSPHTRTRELRADT